MERQPAEETAKQLAALHAEHYRQRSAIQRTIERAKDRAARPWLVFAFTGMFAAWIALHIYAALSGSHADFDPNWLQIILGFLALIMTSLILSGQRQDEELSDERAELTLHMIAIIDQKLSAPKAPAAATGVEEALNALRDAHRDVDVE